MYWDKDSTRITKHANFLRSVNQKICLSLNSYITSPGFEDAIMTKTESLEENIF